MKIKSTDAPLPHSAFLCLGSNLGRRPEQMREAARLIGERCGTVTSLSGLYESDAWGSGSRNRYLNQVLKISTGLSPHELLNTIMEIEREMGRERGAERNADRVMDIDILFYGSVVLDEINLNIPHPRLQERRFVLVPLSEIAPDLLHPRLQKRIRQLQAECSDTGKVEPFNT